MTVARATGAQDAEKQFEIRTISADDLRDALKEGWSDFLSRRGDILFVGLIYPAVGIIAALLAFGGSLLPLLFPVASGLALLGPVAASGFYELARRREHGLDYGWRHFLDVARRPAFEALAAVATLLHGVFIAWVATAALLYVSLFGAMTLDVGTFLNRLFTTPEGWALIIVGNLAGLCFSVLALTISVVSLPMLVDKDVDARTAVRTSVHAVAANKGMMLRWGITVAAMLVLGSIPLFVGLAVVLPVLGFATWHLYTKLVVR
jgi:uncharacterized membrane protein